MNISVETSIAKTENSVCSTDEISEKTTQPIWKQYMSIRRYLQNTKYAIPLFFLAVKTNAMFLRNVTYWTFLSVSKKLQGFDSDKTTVALVHSVL